MTRIVHRQTGVPTLFALALLAVASSLRAASGGHEFQLQTLSSRPDAVSGGDVLIRLSAAEHSPWTAWLDGREITQSFRPADATGSLLGLVTGLAPGPHRLEIRVRGKRVSALQLIDFPLSGPMLSSPAQKPFVCQTEANGLGPALDTNCSAKTVVQYYYRSTTTLKVSPLEALSNALGGKPWKPPSGFKEYDLSGPAPTDVAETVTSEGRTVPYIVRREIGTVNRAVYDIRFLHQPGQPLPTPWSNRTVGWNGRLVYTFGGGCGPGHHQGTLSPMGMLWEPLLARGYAVATATLNIFQNICDDRVAAETLSMVKEHFIKQFGAPLHTIGWGSSGGAVQQYLIAQNYPGLLDGIIPGFSFPDQLSYAHNSSIAECPLLDHAIQTSGLSWTEVQKTAVSGFATWRTCAARAAGDAHVDPKSCGATVPRSAIYDAASNPSGVRCDVFDNEVNVLGVDPKTGFARRLLDNVGVQYGLRAFNEGTIDAEQFIALNERIGGYDDDGRIVQQRNVATLEALQAAYHSGVILTGGAGLKDVPIIDWRQYSDDLGDVHLRYDTFVTRARLTAANASADNQVVLVSPRPAATDAFSPSAALVEQQLAIIGEMDRWLDRIAADRSSSPQSIKVVRNKPVELADGCWATDGERVVEPVTYDGRGRCNLMYPAHGDPRLVAGAPLADDILKCALKPLDADDYTQRLSAEQLQRLRNVFPLGICDYRMPGVGHAVTRLTWQRYGAHAASEARR